MTHVDNKFTAFG